MLYCLSCSRSRAHQLRGEISADVKELKIKDDSTGEEKEETWVFLGHAEKKKDAIPIEFIQERIESLHRRIASYNHDPAYEYATGEYLSEIFVLQELIRMWKEDGRK